LDDEPPAGLASVSLVEGATKWLQRLLDEQTWLGDFAAAASSFLRDNPAAGLAAVISLLTLIVSNGGLRRWRLRRLKEELEVLKLLEGGDWPKKAELRRQIQSRLDRYARTPTRRLWWWTWRAIGAMSLGVLLWSLIAAVRADVKKEPAPPLAERVLTITGWTLGVVAALILMLLIVAVARYVIGLQDGHRQAKLPRPPIPRPERVQRATQPPTQANQEHRPSPVPFTDRE
jgi:hypothetical protein